MHLFSPYVHFDKVLRNFSVHVNLDKKSIFHYWEEKKKRKKKKYKKSSLVSLAPSLHIQLCQIVRWMVETLIRFCKTTFEQEEYFEKAAAVAALYRSGEAYRPPASRLLLPPGSRRDQDTRSDFARVARPSPASQPWFKSSPSLLYLQPNRFQAARPRHSRSSSGA